MAQGITISRGIDGGPDYVIDSSTFRISFLGGGMHVQDWEYTHHTLKDTYCIPTKIYEPLYHILESGGCGGVALLYREWLEKWSPAFRMADLSMLTPEKLFSHLVHLILFEPEKISWKNFPGPR